MQMYLTEKRVVSASLYDYAKKDLPKREDIKEIEQLAESDFYFLSRGEPYYHRYGFYPERKIEQYIRAVIGMKKLLWKDIRESSLQSNIVEELEMLALSCNSLLTDADEAMKWFSAVWTKDPYYLNDHSGFIFTSIALTLKVDTTIQNFWKGGELSMNPGLTKRVRQILASYPPADSNLFYIQTVERTKCTT